MISIRPAKIADAAAMHELQQLAFAEEGRRSGTRDIPPLVEDVASIVQHIQHQIALVAVRDEALVGCVRGVMGEHAYTIRALIVHPTCQGRGVGSTLLKALEAALPVPTRIDLITNTVMEGNVRFYERHGYRVTESTTPLPGITLAHMSKYVDLVH
jgi:ribosomal protein S18 acetylase RimI-like enzyme